MPATAKMKQPEYTLYVFFQSDRPYCQIRFRGGSVFDAHFRGAAEAKTQQGE